MLTYQSTTDQPDPVSMAAPSAPGTSATFAPRPIRPPRMPVIGSPGKLAPVGPTDLGGTAPSPSGVPAYGTGAGAGGGSYATMQQFGPGQDLQATQVNPSESTTLQGMGATAQHAASAYQGYQTPAWQGVAGGSYAPSADTTGLRSQLSQALQTLQSGPSRSQLASQQMALNNEIDDQTFAGEQRQVGQNAAKFGRIGAGMTTNDLTGVLGTHDRNRSQNARQLAMDAASGEIGDRLNTASALGSGFSTLSGTDRADAGFQQSLRDELRGERGAQQAYGQQGFNNARTQYGDATTAENNQRTYESGLRDELRGERGYQSGRADTAFNQGVTSQALTNATNGQNWQQALQLLNMGNSADPTSAYQTAASQQGAAGAAGSQNWAGLLAQWLGNQNRTTGTGG